MSNHEKLFISETLRKRVYRATLKDQLGEEHGSHPGGGKCDRLQERKNPLRQSQGGPGMGLAAAAAGRCSLHLSPIAKH